MATTQSESKPWQDEETLRELYHGEEMSMRDIGEKLGCSNPTIQYWFDKLNMQTRDKSTAISVGLLSNRPEELSDPDWLHQKYHDEGMSTREIGDVIGCSGDTVNRALQRNGVERRNRSESLSGRNHPRWKGGREKYYGPNWQRQRKKTLKRDGYECQRCGMDNDKHKEMNGQSLHVHHITPARTFEDYEKQNDLDNLITLCAKCHRKLEGLPIDTDT